MSHIRFYKAMNQSCFRTLMTETTERQLDHVISLIDKEGTHSVGQFADYWTALAYMHQLRAVYSCRIEMWQGFNQLAALTAI